MPKRKKGNDRESRREAKALARRERKAGLYLSPGDPDFRSLSEQLRVQGLVLRDVLGDGNCLFRALAEQLGDHHGNLRRMAVRHMRANSADYVPFLDEDTSFGSYVDELSKDGTFAGNDAIVAVSRCCGVNVVIHQLGTAGWEVQAPGSAPGSASGSAAPVRTLHIAYLRGEHYCSVCPLQGHPLPKVKKSKEEAVHSAAAAKPLEEPKSVVQCVLEATGCQDKDLAEQCLRETAGDISLAIVELLQLMALTECDSGPVASGEVQVEQGSQLQCSKATSTVSPRHVSKVAKPHLSNRERKEAAKAQRKEAARETRRQRNAANGTNHDKSNSQSLESIEVRTI